MFSLFFLILSYFICHSNTLTKKVDNSNEMRGSRVIGNAIISNFNAFQRNNELEKREGTYPLTIERSDIY